MFINFILIAFINFGFQEPGRGGGRGCGRILYFRKLHTTHFVYSIHLMGSLSKPKQYIQSLLSSKSPCVAFLSTSNITNEGMSNPHPGRKIKFHNQQELSKYTIVIPK